MKTVFLMVGCLTFALATFAQQPVAQQRPCASYQLLTGTSVIQSKNYYLLTLMEEIPEVKNLLKNDPELKKIGQQTYDRLDTALKTCKSVSSCYTEAAKFTPEEIQQVSDRLRSLYTPTNALGKLVSQHLIPSGTYTLYGTSPQELLTKAWQQDAAGINYVIDVYGAGKRPNYPKIDSISFHPTSKSFGTLMHELTDLIRKETQPGSVFFAPTLSYGLRLLEFNERSEAADYEPMRSTVNKAAADRAMHTDWKTFPYTLILVPGAGPDTEGVALSAGGMIRCRLAAQCYTKGMAPFILVSGGRVHPYKTKFSEAYEMKKYLMNELRIPEHAIIMDPHARHTTTNLRNAVRLLFRYGMPVEKPCLVSTVQSQSYYITNDAFVERCRKEIQHVPYRLGKRLTDTEFEFFPVLDALHIDADEPLDP